MRKQAVLAAALAAAMALPVVFLGRAVRPAQENQIPHHNAAAVVKLVAVRVIGPDGRPVADLRKEDFTLYEDGQRKTITEFEIHRRTGRNDAPAAETIVPNPAAGPPATAMTRKIFIFLDLQRMDQEGKTKARSAALSFLETQMRPDDEVGVLGFYSMSGFFVQEYLTSDMARVRRAVLTAGETRTSEGEWVGASPDDEVVSEGKTGGRREAILGGEISANITTSGAVFVPGTAAFQRGDFLSRLGDVAEVFKAIPGNKSLILFSARDLGTEATRLGRLFAASGTAVYPINTQDWDANMFGTKFKHIWLDHPLKDLAASSGGKYFADINESAAIAREMENLIGNFYVLGYYIREAREGKFHSLRIEVARPGVKVFAQDGYADSKPFDQMTDFEKELQLVDLAWADRPVADPLPVPVQALILARSGESPRICLLTRLEIGGGANVPAGRSEVFVFLRDQAGNSLLARRWEADFSRSAGKTICAYITAAPPAGAYEFRLVVRDLKTGEPFLGRSRFDVLIAAAQQMALSSPLLFEEGKELSLMRLWSQTQKGGAEEPKLSDLYPLMPRVKRLVVGEISSGAKRIAVVVPFEISALQPDEQPVLTLAAKLISKADGRQTPLNITARDSKKGRGNTFVIGADVSLPALVAGEYDLEIAVKDIAMDKPATVRTTLIVR